MYQPEFNLVTCTNQAHLADNQPMSTRLSPIGIRVNERSR